MRIKIVGKEAGSIPSETVVTISTTVGREEVIVHQDQASDESVEAGLIGYKDNAALVELPRETVSGRWRVWIPRESVIM